MGQTTHFNKVSGINGVFCGANGSEVQIGSTSGQLMQEGTAVTSSAAELNKLDGVTATTAQLNFVAGVTAGTAAASKAVVLDASSKIDTIDITALKVGGTSVTSSAAELNIMDGVTATAAEINLIDGSVAGTAVASKAAVLGANKNLDTIVIADGGLYLGSGAGTSVTSTAAELNILDGVTATATELNTATDLSVNGALVRVKKLSIGATPTGSEQDTTWDLPLKGLVLDVFVDVTTAETTGATKTLDVGLLASESGGDTDGFLDGISVASTGTVRGLPVFIAGGNETYLSDTTVGALRRVVYLAGADVAGDVGTYAEKPHVLNGTAKSVVYQSGSADFNEFRGDIYIVYVEIG